MVAVKGFLLVLLAQSGLSYNEDPCRGDGGFCMPTSGNCPGNNFVSRKCPTQSGSIKCCLTLPYDEPQCTALGGKCLDDDNCAGGRQESGKCPQQPSGIKCCIKSGGSAGSASGGQCASLGGSCQMFTRCPSVSASGMCPGNSAQRCCLSNVVPTDVIKKHISDEEGGIYLTGYIPLNSGVTIASGVDLGQQNENDLKSRKVPTSIIGKFRPYLGLKTPAQVASAGLSPSSLSLTLDEALKVDTAFLSYLMNRIRPFIGQMSPKGQAVVAALTHWCGWMWPSKPENKCYIQGCPSYFENAISNTKATDAILRRALLDHKTCMGQKNMPQWKLDRIQREINFLDS